MSTNLHYVAAAVSAGFLWACAGDGAGPQPDPPAELLRISGEAQTGRVGETLTSPTVVKVVDARGNGLSGVAVAWTVTEGGGAATPHSATTDANALARATWTLGPTAGANTLRASVPGVPEVAFSATAVPAPSFTVAPLHQWSGGTVVVTSSSLAADTALPTFLAASDSNLVAVRLNDSSAAVTLPITASGPLQLTARRDGYTDTVGTVQVYGQSARVDLTPAPTETFVLGWRGANPMFLGGHNSGDTLVVVDPVASTSTLVSSLRNPGRYYGAGVTHRRDRFVLRDATDTLKVWQLWPAPSVVGLPVANLTGFVRLVAQMTDSTWLFAGGHQTTTYGPTPLSNLWIEDPWNLFVSPRGDRLAMTTVGTLLPGAPVFDTRTGDTAYTLGPIQEVKWADFSPDGGELYVLFGSSVGWDSIVVVDATTGAHRRSVQASDGGFGAHTVTVDPVEDLLYVHGSEGCGPSVVVRSASTLERLGQMSGEGAVWSCSDGGWTGIVAADRVRNRLYVMWNGGALWTFDLIP